jgi:tetratricopeptide (TPR) repeat protein
VKSCLFITLEGLTASALAEARSNNFLPALEPAIAAGQIADLTFPLADARVATLVSTMTGTWPDQHGILMADTGSPVEQTLRPVSVSDRGQAAIWEPLDANGVSCVSVGWPLAISGETNRSAIVTAGFGQTPYPDFETNPSPFVHPKSLAGSLADCWFRPDEVSGEMLAPLVPAWRQVDQNVDNRLGVLSAALAENVSRHAAFLALLDGKPWQFATLCLSLPAEFASLERASESFADRLFEGLAGRGLELLDAFLAEIFRRVPADANLVIAGLPHAETPDVAGFAIVSGPAFEPACSLGRIGILDLTPMIWGVSGFRALGMPGRGGLRALRDSGGTRDFERAWSPHPDYHPLAAAELLHVNGETIRTRESDLLPGEVWQFHSLSVMARSATGREDLMKALPFFTAIVRLKPHDSQAHIQLARCQQLLGLTEEALDSAYEAVDADNGTGPAALLVVAELEALSGHPEISRTMLQRAVPFLLESGHLRLHHANVLVLQREWTAAKELLEIITGDTPLHPHANLLLARCHLAASEWQAAFDHAIISVTHDASKARIHEILGHALYGLGMRDQAWQAFKRATVVDPGWSRPWAKLVMLARQMNKSPDEIARHKSAFLKVKEEEKQRRQALADTARATCC